MLNQTLYPKEYCPTEGQTCRKLPDKDAAHFYEEEHDLLEEYENKVNEISLKKLISKSFLFNLQDPNYDWYEENYGN